ncbi:hypothetical protein B0H14DRAFT_2569248 [Mycena olivaceomarginata]|nr:hypothetical protein B0H14DRAFT_2569248 [Mycena olivaceomarginata]
MPALADQLHAIWSADHEGFAPKYLLRGVDSSRKFPSSFRPPSADYCRFTKLDVLREDQGNKLEKQLEQRGQEMDDDQFEAELDTIVASTVQDLCFKPLCALTLSEPPKWVATSTTDPTLQDDDRRFGQPRP